MREKKICTRTVDLGHSQLVFETGKIAKQADGAVTVRYGDSVVLVTAVSDSNPRTGGDFLPLSVDYRENTYAAGKIPGGFFKREGRQTEKEVLTSRLIDRPIRPMFPDGYNCETQVLAFVLSWDQENNTDVLSVTGAGLALYASNIPFPQPVAAVRVGFVDDEFVINPTFEMLEESCLDLVVAGTASAITMVEAGADEVEEELVLKALEFAHESIKKITVAMTEMKNEMAVVDREYIPPVKDNSIFDRVNSEYYNKLFDAVHVVDKMERRDIVNAIKKELEESLSEEELLAKEDYLSALGDIQKQIVRKEIIEDKIRPDGRKPEEIRKITCEQGVLPRTHGCSLFTRGETQAIVTATLGTPADVQRVDALEGESSKRFMLHYNFPPFSVGETWFMRGPKRREIGHGALAERALRPLLPSEEEFAYTIRIVSDILESNGSSSMASVCGGSLALFDAGVPMKSAVAGIAMGLMMEGDNYTILSDIAGYEDHFGDMDFKVTGTRKGITALQMDIKIEGLNTDIMKQALDQAKAGRFHILDIMDSALSEPRQSISMYAPKMITMIIDKEKIRDVIGSGGKTIRSIIERTGAAIDIDDDGTVNVSGVSGESVEQAVAIIQQITEEAEVGKTYLGTVRSLKDYGAFVEVLPGTDGLLHISEVADYRVKNITDELEEGQEILVKVIGIDERGRIKLSKKAASQDIDDSQE